VAGSLTGELTALVSFSKRRTLLPGVGLHLLRKRVLRFLSLLFLLLLERLRWAGVGGEDSPSVEELSY
jgi:hypothetical protein